MPKPVVDSPPLLDEFALVSLYTQCCQCIHGVQQPCVHLEPMLLPNAFLIYNTLPMLVCISQCFDPKPTPSLTSMLLWASPWLVPTSCHSQSPCDMFNLKLNLLWCPLCICKHCSSKYWTSRIGAFKSRYGQHSNYTPSSCAITKSLLLRRLCLVFARVFKGSKSSPEFASCFTVGALPDRSKPPTCHWEFSFSMTLMAVGFVSPQRSWPFTHVHCHWPALSPSRWRVTNL